MKTISRAVALVRVEMNVDLQEDDTANGEIIFALSQEMLALAGEESLDDMINAEQDIDGAVTERYESEDTNDAGDPNFVGTRSTFRGQPLAEFDAAGDGLSVVRDGDDYVVSGEPEDLSAQTGGQELPADAEITMSVTFPGSVSSHNGELDGNTVTWNLATHTGAIEARGSASEGGGFPTWLIIAIIALVGVGIGIAVVLVASSKRKDTDSAAPVAFGANDGDIQGTVNTADAGEGTVLPPAEPVVEAEQVVDTTEDEDPNRA